MRLSPSWHYFKFKSPHSTSREVHSLSNLHSHYIRMFWITMTLGGLLFWLPAFYIVHLNQGILTELFLENQPGLIMGLDLEFTMLKFSFFISLLSVSFGAVFLTKRMLNRISKPLLDIEAALDHLQTQPHGQLQMAKNNDKIYQKFVEYVESVQEERREQIEILQNIQISHTDRQNFMLLDVLRRRLNYELNVTNGSAEPSGAAASERRVS